MFSGKYNTNIIKKVELVQEAKKNSQKNQPGHPEPPPFETIVQLFDSCSNLD